MVLQNVFPPEKVQPSFNAVNQAEQQRETRINTAQSQYNEVIPRARGRADRAVQSAEGYAFERVNRARGEAQRFTSVYAEYRRAPEVTRQRLYLETMADILPRAGRKIVVDEEVRGLVPLLNLDGGVTPATAPAPQGGN